VRADRIRKSVGRERTFGQDLHAPAELQAALDRIIEDVWRRIEKQAVVGRTVTLKLKYADFRQITRRKSLDQPVPGREQFAAIARELLTGELPVSLGVRLLGVTLSGLCPLDARPASAEGDLRVDPQQSFDF
jgi:DNA polymerase-4